MAHPNLLGDGAVISSVYVYYRKWSPAVFSLGDLLLQMSGF
jgi:hypothetical protein